MGPVNIEQLTPRVRELALQAGMREERFMSNPPKPTGAYLVYAPALERFAALVAEHCASIVDREVGAQDSMDAIRAAFPMPKDFGVNQSIDDPATADEKNRRMRALVDSLPMPKG
jgi:hypothetical protein